MDGTHERVDPGVERGHVVRPLLGPGEDVAREDGRAAADALDLHVVRDPGVLVVELDGERLARGGRQLGRVERDVEGRDLQHGPGGGRRSGRAARRGRARGTRRSGRRRRRKGVGPAIRYRRRLGGGAEVGVAPAGERLDVARGVEDGLQERGVADDVLPLVGRAQEVDQLVDLLVVERTAIAVVPDGHEAAGVAADVAAAGVEHVAQVLLVEVDEQLHLVVEHGADAALALRTVAARAVGLVDVVAALDGRDVLLLAFLLEAAGAGDSGHAQLVEVVDDHEQGHDERGKEADPPGVARLADDPRGALGRQRHVVRGRWGAEAVRRRGLGGRPRNRQPLLSIASGLVGHQTPRVGGRRSAWSGRGTCAVRCSRSGRWAG